MCVTCSLPAKTSQTTMHVLFLLAIGGGVAMLMLQGFGESPIKVKNWLSKVYTIHCFKNKQSCADALADGCCTIPI